MMSLRFACVSVFVGVSTISLSLSSEGRYLREQRLLGQKTDVREVLVTFKPRASAAETSVDLEGVYALSGSGSSAFFVREEEPKRELFLSTGKRMAVADVSLLRADVEVLINRKIPVDWQSSVPHPEITGNLSDATASKAPTLPSELSRNDLVAGLVRLSFHDAGTFDKVTDTGGIDGCVDISDPDNVGLELIIDELAPLVNKYKNLASRADVWAFAANVAIETAANSTVTQGYGGNNIFKEITQDIGSLRNFSLPPFRFGRKDSTKDAKSCHKRDLGRLPSAEKAGLHLKETMVERMGFTMDEVTALMGAHTLGRGDSAVTGYHGAWVETAGPSNAVFDNEYYQTLLSGYWVKKTEESSEGAMLTVWRRPGPDCYLNESGENRVQEEGHSVIGVAGTVAGAVVEPSEDTTIFGEEGELEFGNGIGSSHCELLMLNTDIALTFDLDSLSDGSEPCSVAEGEALILFPALEHSTGGHASASHTTGSCRRNNETYKLVTNFAMDNSVWLSAFSKAWTKLQKLGVDEEDLYNPSAAAEDAMISRWEVRDSNSNVLVSTAVRKHMTSMGAPTSTLVDGFDYLDVFTDFSSIKVSGGENCSGKFDAFPLALDGNLMYLALPSMPSSHSAARYIHFSNTEGHWKMFEVDLRKFTHAGDMLDLLGNKTIDEDYAIPLCHSSNATTIATAAWLGHATEVSVEENPKSLRKRVIEVQTILRQFEPSRNDSNDLKEPEYEVSGGAVINPSLYMWAGLAAFLGLLGDL